MLLPWSLGLALAVAASTSHAQDCSALTQTTLTSVGCPTECGSASATCVLYAPGQTKCQSYKSSGPCLQQDGFTVPGSTDKCSVTYQCQGNLVDEGTTKWHLALLTSKAADTVFTAAVQTTRRLAYPTDAKVANTIQVDGGIDRTARGDFADFKPDNSFFATPSNIIGFYVAHIDMYNLLPRINFSAVAWVNVAFKNANLSSVPLGLNQLGTQYLDLSMNYITTIDDPTPLSKVSTLNLAYNNLTTFTVELPAITTLNLSLNSFTTIPEVIFNMKTLTTLSMRKCNISNAQLTEAQFTFLEERTLDVDFTVTNCAPGYEERQLSGGTGRVCLPATNKGTKSGSKVPLIAGIAGGVVVVLLLVYFLCRRSKRDGDYYDEVTKDPTVTQDLTFGTTTGETSAIWNDPDLLAVRIEYRDIEPIKLLSRGGFGEVWLGLYMNENVAIKRLLSDKKSMNDALAFASEVKIMARLDHPKIVRFIGVAWTNALTIQAVTEFMDCGDLRSLLDSNRASSLTWANLKCQIAIDIVDALVYLHTLNPKLIHRDLKSRNVLIDANTGAKLSDFGISRNRSVEETMTAGVGTARWIAPEVILGGHYTEFADIYSFGVVLSELDTCKSPFHDAVNTNGAKMQDVTILQLVSAGKLQPTFNNDCPEPIVRLARACLSFDAAQRPSAIHISYELRKILKDLSV